MECHPGPARVDGLHWGGATFFLVPDSCRTRNCKISVQESVFDWGKGGFEGQPVNSKKEHPIWPFVVDFLPGPRSRNMLRTMSHHTNVSSDIFVEFGRWIKIAASFRELFLYIASLLNAFRCGRHSVCGRVRGGMCGEYTIEQVECLLEFTRALYGSFRGKQI